MAKEPSGIFTLRNFGRENNCTFANIYPSKVNVLHMQVGADTQEAKLNVRHSITISHLYARMLESVT